MNNCQICQRTNNLTLIKVANSDPEYNLIKGKTYPFCPTCSPKIKEYNDYDLLNENPHLWDKYPYSDAKKSSGQPSKRLYQYLSVKCPVMAIAPQP